MPKEVLLPSSTLLRSFFETLTTSTKSPLYLKSTKPTENQHVNPQPPSTPIFNFLLSIFNSNAPPFYAPSMWVLCALFETDITVTEPVFYPFYTKYTENQIHNRKRPSRLPHSVFRASRRHSCRRHPHPPHPAIQPIPPIKPIVIYVKKLPVAVSRAQRRIKKPRQPISILLFCMLLVCPASLMSEYHCSPKNVVRCPSYQPDASFCGRPLWPSTILLSH